MNKEQATSELVRLGVLSSNFVHEPVICDSGCEQEDEEDVVVWTEAIPRQSQHHGQHSQYSAFRPTWLPLYDHGSVMTEVFKRDNIEWRMVRVAFSQPYATESMLLATKQTVQEVHNVDMQVFPTLSWYNPGKVLAVYRPFEHMSFETFRMTFRYWLICNSDPQNYGNFRAGVLPVSLNAPRVQFFDLTLCGDVQSVRLVCGRLPLKTLAKIDVGFVPCEFVDRAWITPLRLRQTTPSPRISPTTRHSSLSGLRIAHRLGGRRSLRCASSPVSGRGSHLVRALSC